MALINDAFIGYIIERIKKDPGYAAKLRRGDNPDTDYEAWSILASFSIDIQKDYLRLPYLLIGAAIARAKPEKDGTFNLGASLASCFEAQKQTGPEYPGDDYLKRLLTCDDISEVCRVLRPMLSLIASNQKKAISYERLLRDLLNFNSAGQERIKLAWASEFYRNGKDDNINNNSENAKIVDTSAVDNKINKKGDSDR